MELKASNFTRNEFETLVNRLSTHMNDKFSFDTNKTGKLRDVVAGQLFDAGNGFKSIVGAFKEDELVIPTTVAFPLSDINFSLPDTIYLHTSIDLDFLSVHYTGGLQKNGSGFAPSDHKFKIWELTKNGGSYRYILSSLYEPSIFERDEGGYHLKMDNSHLLRYIVQHYHVISAESDINSEGGYGGVIEDIVDLGNKLSLDCGPIKKDPISELLSTGTISDLLSVTINDESCGTPEVLLKLVRKTTHEVNTLPFIGLTNVNAGKVDMILIEPFSTLFYNESRSILNMPYDLVGGGVIGLIHPESKLFHAFVSFPLTVNGRIVGYARNKDAQNNFVIMLENAAPVINRLWKSGEWSTSPHSKR